MKYAEATRVLEDTLVRLRAVGVLPQETQQEIFIFLASVRRHIHSPAFSQEGRVGDVWSYFFE